jgi:type II secretory pathway component PulK
MACKNRGMALVSTLLLFAVLLTLAQILVQKVWQSTGNEAQAVNRDQLFWAAQAGIEEARKQLAVHYASSGGWQNFLTADIPHAYPETPVWIIIDNGLSVEIFLRDNLDGDNDVHKDNDLKIYALARARGQQGKEVMIESLCGFDLPATAAAPPATETSNGAETGIGITELPVACDAIAN